MAFPAVLEVNLLSRIEHRALLLGDHSSATALDLLSSTDWHLARIGNEETNQRTFSLQKVEEPQVVKLLIAHSAVVHKRRQTLLCVVC